MIQQSEFMGFYLALDGFPPEFNRYYAVFRVLTDGIFFTEAIPCVGDVIEDDYWIRALEVEAKKEALMYFRFVKRVREISA